MRSKVIIDTNGLMIPGQFGVDIFSELERLGFNTCLVPSASIKELEKIYARAHGRDRIAAQIALSLVDRCTIIEKSGPVDDIIIDMAIDTDAAVLTNDIELKKRLCSKGVTIIHLRGKTHLSI
ncbi:PilT domain protein [Candidatus Methanoperedens nitroreducens]|uniref:PilT domain protein n=1 Tax=Candidatus Methanoperedens nitratireducens TaxID=1392998 RepID=A0A062V579_9EURY|nr:PilT domain protein [Candidatus Methanoperedens nitroreducens]MDJ1421708.1 DNA-binding protein [Candidatus Methanoperedens sp.]